MKLAALILIIASISLNGLTQRAELILGFNKIRIGEQISMILTIEYVNENNDILVGWPQFNDEFTEHIEIIDRTVDFEKIVDTLNHVYSRTQEFQITCFQPGIHMIPSIGIELNDSVYHTYSTSLIVETVEIDTSKSITDIKENYSVEYSFGEKVEDWFKYYWPWIASAGGLLAIFFLFKLFKNRKEEEEEIPFVPVIPAHITALKSLQQLESEKAWLSEEQKEYYSELTYTVRLYLEQRFGINAVEQTTREIISELKFADISEEDRLHLRKLLSQADMIKFAKMKTGKDQGKDSLYKSIDFVQKTKNEDVDKDVELD